MGQRVIYVHDGAACYSCWGYLEAGDPVETYYGNVPGVMPEDGQPFGVPVNCSCCTNADEWQRKKNQKRKTTHLGCRGAD